MICGAAVVCTDNRGYREMAIDGRTALVAPVGMPRRWPNGSSPPDR